MSDGLERAEEMLAAIQAGVGERAEHIQPNQCPGCDAYRLDGHPPEIHEHGCPWEGDSIERMFRRMRLGEG